MASDSYRSDPERAAQLAVYLALHAVVRGGDKSPTRIGALVAEMQKAARSTKRQAENACNYPMSEAQQERAAKRQDRAQAFLNAGLRHLVPEGANHDCDAPTIELGGDPRGPCAVLHIPGQRGDGWGDGFAVY